MKNLDRYGMVIGILTATLIILVISGFEFVHLGFNPLNGHFQNYNSLSRLLAGQIPYRDFPAYLGSAALFLPFPGFFILGGNLSASNASTEFICGVMSFLSFVVLLRLCGTRPLLAWTIGAFLGTLPWPMLMANQSAIGIRSFLPFLAVMLFRQITKTDKSHLVKFCLLGLLAGMMPLWSNDYGIPTFLVFSFVSFIYLPDSFKMPIILKSGIIFFLSAIASFGILLNLVTRGNPLTWFQFSQDVSLDQFWYFNPNTSAKVFGLDTLPIDIFIALSVLPLLMSVIFWSIRGRQSHWAFVVLIIFSTIGGVAISGIIGTFELRYFAPLWRVDIVFIPYIVLEIFKACFKKQKTTSVKWMRIRNIFHGEVALASCLLAFLFVWKYEVGLIWHPPEETDIFVQELGGAVPASYKDAIDIARAMKIEMDKKKIPPNRRLLSTYATMVSVLSGSQQDTPDYIIHALGSKRHLFADALDQGYQRVETINPDFFIWGRWNLRTSWPFFRKLFLEWKPVTQTPWSFIWEKRELPLKPEGQAICQMSPDQQDGFTRYTITSAVKEPYWTEVTLNLKTSLVSNGIPIIGSRGIIEIAEEPSKRIGNTYLYSSYQELQSLIVSSWTAPLKDGLVVFPVMLEPNRTTTLAIRSLPIQRSSVLVSDCSAQLFMEVSKTLLSWTGERGGDIALRGVQTLDPQMFQWTPNGKAIYLTTQDPLAPSRVKIGDIAVLPNGKTTKVILRDFYAITLAWDESLELTPGEQITNIVIKPQD